MDSGFFLSVYSRPKTESFDPSLRARTKMMSCHSTVCWSSPAAARSRPVCTQLPNPQTRQLWMRTRMRRRRPQVLTQPLKPYTGFNVLQCTQGKKKSSKCQHERRSVPLLPGSISVSSDATQLDRGPGTPSQLRPWTLPSPSPGTGANHRPLNESPFYKTCSHPHL